MIANPSEMMLVSKNASQLLTAVNPEAFNVLVLNEPGEAMEKLRDGEFDVVVLDDDLFGAEIVRAVREIKRRFPLVPVLVVSDNTDSVYQTGLMEAGVTDFLTHTVSQDELLRRLRLVLQQRRQNRALARRNSNLQALNTLVRRLHTATDPKTLIAETIDLACRTFKLYGIAIAMNEGDALHIYAGKEGATKSSLYDSLIHAHQYDPMMRVINSGFVQTFTDIKTDSYFTPIPILPKVASAIIVPLAYPEYTYGALTVFGTGSRPLHDDLIIYELFAAQFTTALQNARHYEEQERRVQFSAHMLKAWQKFITLDNPQDIPATLRRLVEEVPSVNQALVWLYEGEMAENVIVDAPNRDLVEIFTELHLKGHINKVLEEVDERLQVTLQLGRGHKDPLGPLYRGLRGQQLMLFPITDSARLVGGVIASSMGGSQFGLEDANLMKSLAHAAGQALVRNTLTAVMGEKGGRLEAILRSIYEGIFFVDNTGHVAFVNTQFAELTAINPSDVLYRHPDLLLDLLAKNSTDPEKIHDQLHQAVQSVLSSDSEERENYSVLEITLTPAGEITVEFTQIRGALDDEYFGWIGIIRQTTRSQGVFNNQMALLDVMSEQIRLPHAELRGLVSTLLEQHMRLSNRERERFLRQIERNVDHVGQLWENFLDVYSLEISGLALEREDGDLYDVLQNTLESRALSDRRRQIRIEAPARLPLVRVDELRMSKVITNMLLYALSVSPKGAPIDVKLESQGAEVRVTVQDQGPGLPPNRVDTVFDPFYHNDDDANESMGLGLYLSRELARRHGGELWSESAQGRGTTMILSLPTAQSDGIVILSPRHEVAEPAETAHREEHRHSGYSVQKRQPKTIMIVEGKSALVIQLRNKLKAQGYELLGYKSGEDALRDVNATRLDLIVLDVNLSDTNSLDICERMRKRTQVPIVMLADEASVAEELRALKYADAFITKPISEDQLMARVDVILKRVADLPTRTREPLDLGELYIDFARREVYLHNKPVELTRIEYDLLNTLAINENQVLTHKQLLDKVWGPEYQAETQYLWVNVSRLRKKLEPTPESPRYIHTQQGVGYVFRRP